MIRIIGGSLKGKLIKVPERPDLRPTSNKVREAVFDILGARVSIAETRFLDAYAGTGAVGLEALSRGAAFVEFVEENRASTEALRTLLNDLGLSARSRVTRGARPSEDDFDLAFSDPPYNADPDLSAVADRLRPGALYIHESASTFAPVIGGLTPLRSYRYGKTSLHLYERMTA